MRYMSAGTREAIRQAVPSEHIEALERLFAMDDAAGGESDEFSREVSKVLEDTDRYIEESTRQRLRVRRELLELV